MFLDFLIVLPSSLTFANMQERSWALGDETVDELYEYKTLAVYIRTKMANLMLILMKILKNS